MLRQNTIRLISILLFAQFFIASASKAQWYDPEKVNKKAAAIYVKAYDFAMNGEYEKSIIAINDALKIEPKYVEAYLSRASVYAELKNYKLSVDDFEKAMMLDSVFSETYNLPYSISLAGTGQFNKALDAINKFLSLKLLNEQSRKSATYRKSTYEFAISLQEKEEVKNYVFEPKNVGSGINTDNLEYFPSLTIDGRKMIFNRRIGDDEDFYESEFLDGKWSKANPVQGKLNTNYNEGAQAISQDERWLIFTGCNYPEGIGSCDLYISYKTKNGEWTEAANLGDIVNTEFWESTPSISPDKKDLYFSSNRPGGFGGKDIWVSHRQSNGKWSVPENLGPKINTIGDETCPFIHADNQTLYFNSNGLMGYGMSDLFLSRKDEEGEWTTPENLGYPINTIDDEGSLVVASDGKTSYYASDRGERKSGLDIYFFELRKGIRANRTLWVNGKVFDEKTGNGIPCSIELTDINSRKAISKIQTDEEGNYLITLPAGKDYAFNVNRKNYLFYSDNFSLTNDNADTFFTKNIPMKPIEAGANVILKNIFFKTADYGLDSSSFIELDKLVALLNENPAMKLLIGGHTDNSGKKETNVSLSLNRAKSVVDYITSKGVAAARLQAKGFGDSKPIASNETEQGKSLNRRTEITVVSN